MGGLRRKRREQTCRGIGECTLPVTAWKMSRSRNEYSVYNFSCSKPNLSGIVAHPAPPGSTSGMEPWRERVVDVRANRSSVMLSASLCNCLTSTFSFSCQSLAVVEYRHLHTAVFRPVLANRRNGSAYPTGCVSVCVCVCALLMYYG